MTTLDYRPLPDALNDAGAFAKPMPEPTQMPPMELPPEFAQRAAREETEKQARLPYVDLFRSGQAAYGGLTMPYRLYTPQTEPGKRYPLVVFLHGGGERGDDNVLPLIANDGALVWVKDQLEGTGEPCFVLAAQCPSEGFGWMQDHLLVCSAALDAVIAENPVDEARLYLTGMSMGGGGCWRMNYLFPNRFAAVVPMCSAACIAGPGQVDQIGVGLAADAFVGKPLWIVHAADDFVVTPETSRSLVRALEARGQDRDRDFYYTEYPAVCGYNHACWEPAYADPTLRRWLFKQSLQGR